VILSDLQSFVDTFFYGDGRYHDDKLCEIIAFVQLENCAEIDIGFAGAGFHLDGKVTGF